MNKIKYALGLIAGLLMISCSDSDEAVLYESFDFISISGDSVISREGLQMVASQVDIRQDTIWKDEDHKTFEINKYSELSSQVTVGNNRVTKKESGICCVYDVDMLIKGTKAGHFAMAEKSGYEYGTVRYRELQSDSTFKVDYYSIQSSEVDWEDVDKKTVLFTVRANCLKMINDSTLGKARLTLNGKIRAIRN